MNVLYSDEFLKRYRRLPKSTQQLYRRQELLFHANWRDPRLHIKKLRGEPLVYSFRVTRSYRVLFMFVEPETIFMTTIGHRKDVYD